MAFGDFNEVLGPEDRSSGKLNQNGAHQFNDWLEMMEIMDNPLSGQTVAEKMRNMKKPIKMWHKQKFGDIDGKIVLFEEEINK
ncbi:hypothetical protein PIB30_013306 [Stylosanthes scabra]|uniref:Endonuclease/exonuclease/phosphatase n=1 Tax=Stylosanthes scabra TaxID=79078 RepID=A0ABU6T666_9FABA|nr:hypothetical protein [Stylosanthes scabra]